MSFWPMVSFTTLWMITCVTYALRLKRSTHLLYSIWCRSPVYGGLQISTHQSFRIHVWYGGVTNQDDISVICPLRSSAAWLPEPIIVIMCVWVLARCVARIVWWGLGATAADETSPNCEVGCCGSAFGATTSHSAPAAADSCCGVGCVLGDTWWWIGVWCDGGDSAIGEVCLRSGWWPWDTVIVGLDNCSCRNCVEGVAAAIVEAWCPLTSCIKGGVVDIVVDVKWSPLWVGCWSEGPSRDDSTRRLVCVWLKDLIMVLDRAWETMIKSYYSTLTDWFCFHFVHRNLIFSALKWAICGSHHGCYGNRTVAMDWLPRDTNE